MNAWQMSVKITIAAFALLSGVTLAPATGLAASPARGEDHPLPPANVAPITQETFDEMLSASTEDKGGVSSEQGDTLRVELAEDAKVLFFTRPGHRAHPGIVEVRIVEDDGLPSLATSGWWGRRRGCLRNMVSCLRAP